MFWNKKDDKQSLPDLPPLSPEFKNLEIPTISKSHGVHEEKEDIQVDKHPLPSFPDSPNKKGFSQSAIKGAIESKEEQEAIAEEFSPIPLPSPVIQKTSPIAETPSNIFVKIDKFNSARKSLALAEQKIEEINQMLKKIRETRMREEQELTAWEREVETTKARIEEASKNLFDKLS